MDPVDLERLLYELRSVNAETITIPRTLLTPGCVIAGPSPWDHHVVTKPPVPVNAYRVMLSVRHLRGGHNSTRVLASDRHDEIYRHRLRPTQLALLPTIPRCIVPQDPQPGDRVVYHAHEVHRLGEGRFFEYNGSGWQQVQDIIERGRPRTIVRMFPQGIERIVSNTAAPDPLGWYTYLPAGHRPFLYVDGVPMPARAVDELVLGDVIRLPGGGKLSVTGIRRYSSSTAVLVTLAKKSIHPMRHFLWDRSEGAVAEHHDSRRTGSLYPTEPRHDEMISAVGLRPGDTVITAWGRPYSTVATVGDVWGKPLLNHMNVYCTATDGRSMRIVTGLENSYYLLHRAEPTVSHAFAADEPIARGHS